MAAQPRLRAYVRSLVFNHGDVDDIIQDVAIIGWEKFEQYDASRPFDAWLLGIARNLVYRYYETQKNKAMQLSETAIEKLEAIAFDTAGKADSLRDALDSCLQKLGRDDYEVVKLRYTAGANNRTVAERLDYSESKVSRLLNRVYAQLLLCIKQHVRLSEARS